MLKQDLQLLVQTLDSAMTQSGQRLVELCDQSPVLLLFLRHAGCPFCREALSDIARLRHALVNTGARIVLVHMGDLRAIEKLLHKNGLDELDRIVDPGRRLYQAFGLKRATLPQLLAPQVLVRGVQALIAGHGLGLPSADSSQMPGLFLIYRGRILRRFRHRTVADRPDYLKMCAEATQSGRP
jgi:peroxiredoxin